MVREDATLRNLLDLGEATHRWLSGRMSMIDEWFSRSVTRSEVSQSDFYDSNNEQTRRNSCPPRCLNRSPPPRHNGTLTMLMMVCFTLMLFCPDEVSGEQYYLVELANGKTLFIGTEPLKKFPKSKKETPENNRGLNDKSVAFGGEDYTDDYSPDENNSEGIELKDKKKDNTTLKEASTDLDDILNLETRKVEVKNERNDEMDSSGEKASNSTEKSDDPSSESGNRDKGENQSDEYSNDPKTKSKKPPSDSDENNPYLKEIAKLQSTNSRESTLSPLWEALKSENASSGENLHSKNSHEDNEPSDKDSNKDNDHSKGNCEENMQMEANSKEIVDCKDNSKENTTSDDNDNVKDDKSKENNDPQNDEIKTKDSNDNPNKSKDDEELKKILEKTKSNINKLKGSFLDDDIKDKASNDSTPKSDDQSKENPPQGADEFGANYEDPSEDKPSKANSTKPSDKPNKDDLKDRDQESEGNNTVSQSQNKTLLQEHSFESNKKEIEHTQENNGSSQRKSYKKIEMKKYNNKKLQSHNSVSNKKSNYRKSRTTVI